MRLRPIEFGDYENVFILTGAGISVASGLATYRGPGGLWTKLDVERIAHARNLPGTLPELWELYRERRAQVLAAEPNAAHRAIADLQNRTVSGSGPRVTLVTQNVDGLHRRAGSPAVLEMHGSAFRTRCYNDACPLPSFADERLYDETPTCPLCGSYLRPDVVLFGENIASAILEQIAESLSQCDLFLSIGTSGVVWPAARFVAAAFRLGARTISVNVEASDNSAFGEEYLGPAEEVLPQLLGMG